MNSYTEPASTTCRKWRKGQTMVEYAMILAAIAVTVSAGFNVTGRYTDRSVNRASTLLVAQHDD